jgi:tetratricopeptide (TPR) repeat protein
LTIAAPRIILRPMQIRATSLLAIVGIAAFVAQAPALAAAPATVAPQTKLEAPPPPPRTPAEAKAELYARLAASKDSDETDGLVDRLFELYTQSGSDTGDLLLARARQAMVADAYPAAQKILDAAIALLPDWAEGWNARATVRYLDDDYRGSMADIAETLKREPRHLGALMGMGAILQSSGKREEALKVYERALAIAPHWSKAEAPVERLKAALAGQDL